MEEIIISNIIGNPKRVRKIASCSRHHERYEQIRRHICGELCAAKTTMDNSAIDDIACSILRTLEKERQYA